MRFDPATEECTAAQRHQSRLKTGEVEAALLKREAHVATTVEIFSNEAPVHHRIVCLERRGRCVFPLERLEGRTRGEHSRLHRVVDALERRDFDEACRIAYDHEAIPVSAFRQGVIASFGNRLRAPLDHFSAVENLPEKGV